jgi:mono/diheme cytochrome c family protein
MKIKILLIVMGLFICSCNSNTEEKTEKDNYEEAKTETVDLVKRGEYLVNTIGCHDCHTPKIMTEKGPALDPNRILSGHPEGEVLPEYDKEILKSYALFNMNLTAAIGPWGTSFAANLTPDDTGIGSWTEDQFLYSIKNGKFKGLEGSRDLLPPMPWPFYSQMTDEDLKAIFAYLKSIKPVNNLVPAPIPPEMKTH